MYYTLNYSFESPTARGWRKHSKVVICKKKTNSKCKTNTDHLTFSLVLRRGKYKAAKTESRIQKVVKFEQVIVRFL